MTIRMPELSDAVFAFRHINIPGSYYFNELCQSDLDSYDSDSPHRGYLDGDSDREVEWGIDPCFYSRDETYAEGDMRRLRCSALGNCQALIEYVDKRPLTDDYLLITRRPGELRLSRVQARVKFKSLSLFSLANYQHSILGNAELFDPSNDFMSGFGAEWVELVKAKCDQVVNAHQTWLEVGDYLPVRLEDTNQSACVRLQTKLDDNLFEVEAFLVGELQGGTIAEIASTVVARVGGAELMINTPLGTIHFSTSAKSTL